MLTAQRLKGTETKGSHRTHEHETLLFWFGFLHMQVKFQMCYKAHLAV